MEFRYTKQYNIFGIIFLIILCSLTLFCVLFLGFPLRLIIVPITIIIGFIVSIIHIILSVKNKKIHLFGFYVLFIILSLIIGIKIESKIVERIKNSAGEIFFQIKNETNEEIYLKYSVVEKIYSTGKFQGRLENNNIVNVGINIRQLYNMKRKREYYKNKINILRIFDYIEVLKLDSNVSITENDIENFSVEYINKGTSHYFILKIN